MEWIQKNKQRKKYNSQWNYQSVISDGKENTKINTFCRLSESSKVYTGLNYIFSILSDLILLYERANKLVEKSTLMI